MPVHITEADAARDFSAIMEKVRGGENIVIDDAKGQIHLTGEFPVPRTNPLLPRHTRPRLLSQAIAEARAFESGVTLDDKFGDDLEAIISQNSSEKTFDPWA